MNFKTTVILVKHYIGNTSKYLNILYIFFGLILLSTFPVKWDITQNSVTFFGIPFELYGQSREYSLVTLVNEWFSWAWIIIAIFSLSKLLKKLSESFSVKEMLWLRLLPCSPYEVSLAKALWIIAYAVFLGMFGTIWAIICASYHHVSINELLINVEGLVSHVLLSGGIVLALNLVIPIGESEQNSISAIALIFPLILMPIYLGINRLADENILKYFPYSFPFNTALENTVFHFGIAILIGVILLGLHTLLKFRFSHVKVTVK